jgi:hypothetical protein
MAIGARYAIVPGSDTAVTIPPPGGLNDKHYQNIDAPGVDQGRSAVLFFKMESKGTPRLRMRIGTSVLVDSTFDETPRRTFSEIIPGSALKAADNELIVSVTGSGSVIISDIVFLYTATI